MRLGIGPETWRIRSSKGTHYTGALLQNAIAIEDLGVIPDVGVVVERVTVWSDQNLDWDIAFFRSQLGQPDADLDLNTVVDWIKFEVADGIRFGGAGPYIYSVSGLWLKYRPVLKSALIGLVNRNAVAKIAGAAGEVVVEIEGSVL